MEELDYLISESTRATEVADSILSLIKKCGDSFKLRLLQCQYASIKGYIDTVEATINYIKQTKKTEQ